MKLKTILTIAAVLLLINGLEALLAPEFFVSQLGSETNTTGLIGYRAVGAGQFDNRHSNSLI